MGQVWERLYNYVLWCLHFLPNYCLWLLLSLRTQDRKIFANFFNTIIFLPVINLSLRTQVGYLFWHSMQVFKTPNYSIWHVSSLRTQANQPQVLTSTGLFQLVSKSFHIFCLFFKRHPYSGMLLLVPTSTNIWFRKTSFDG